MNPCPASPSLDEPPNASAADLPTQVRLALALLGPLDTPTLAALLSQTRLQVEQALLTLAESESESEPGPEPRHLPQRSDAQLLDAARKHADLLARAVQLFLQSEQIERAAELVLKHGSPELQLDLLSQAGWALFYSTARPLLGQMLKLNALQPRLQQGELLGLQYIWTIAEAGEPHQVERRLPTATGLSPALRATLQARIAQMFDQPERAIQQAQIAIEAYPNDLQLPALLARYTLGLALLDAGHPQAAIAPLSAALKGANRDRATLLQIDALAALSEVHEVLDLAAPAQLYAQEARRLRLAHDLQDPCLPLPAQDYRAFPQLLDLAEQQLLEGDIAAAAIGIDELVQRERKAFYCFKWRNRLLHAQSHLASLRHQTPALKAIAAGFATTGLAKRTLYELELAVLQAGCALLAAQSLAVAQLQDLAAELQARPLPLLLGRLKLILALNPNPGPDLAALLACLNQADESHETDEADARWLGAKLAGPLAALLATPTIVHHAQARHRATNLLALLRQAAQPPTTSPPSESNKPPPLGLTSREWQVLRLIAEHYSNEQIAATLFVSVATVKTHINRVYSKLNIASREEAIQRARHLNG